MNLYTDITIKDVKRLKEACNEKIESLYRKKGKIELVRKQRETIQNEIEAYTEIMIKLDRWETDIRNRNKHEIIWKKKLEDHAKESIEYYENPW